MVPMENSSSIFEELDIGNSAESFQNFLESQKELFHGQIAQLQNIVTTQCKLTGVNPLSQEMAAGALSIKIGKRPRDLLNPKAVKYMQSVFSIKDTISKKESREISALCGVTVTQVREFFASQRSRVRKIVRMSREKAIRSNACNESQERCSSISDPAIPIDQVPLNSMGPATVEEAPSCSAQEDTIPGLDDSDKTFVQNIFNLMKTEETFSGQVRLMEWILKIQNPSVLNWFLTKGGVMILATWLSQAALEEQTTVLLVILKVLCHLPLHKALPAQMSAILQIVNRLRFYRTSDISNRARVLLSRWSKLFVRSQAQKKPCSTKLSGDAQKEMIQMQTVGEILSNESWPSKVNIPEDIFALTNGNSESWKMEPTQPLKLLPASTDDSNKKHVRSVSSSQTRERRQVLIVEQPGQRTASRSPQVGKAVVANQGRPLSADDIQKAKMRAMFMQSKYGKTGSPSNKSCQQKTEDPNKSSASQTGYVLPAPKTLVRPKTLEETKPVVVASRTPILFEAPLIPKPREQPSLERLRSDQIPWQMPPEVRINCLWRVRAGEKSKEVEIQIGRIRREKETIYQCTQHIPLNPKEPWDVEMDYDDSLTPEIPTEQPADGAAEAAPPSPRDNKHAGDASIATIPTPSQNSTENVDAAVATTPSQISTGNAAPEPDLELLAVLLKNPELVFALTSGQNGNLTSADTVRLLDMIKASGISSPEILTGLGGRSEQRVEVMTSLPSPTPSTDPVMSGWRSEVANDSALLQFPTATRNYAGFSGVHTTIPFQDNLPATSTVQPQQLPAVVHRHSSPQLAMLSEEQLSTIIPRRQHPLAPMPPVPEDMFSVRHFPAATLPIQNPSMRMEISSLGQDNVRSAPVSIVLNMPRERERPPITLPSLPALLPTPLRQPPPLLIRETPSPVKPLYSAWPGNSADLGSRALLFDSGSSSSRQGSASYSLSQANQNSYNLYRGGGPMQRRGVQPGAPWGVRSEILDEPELEMWSPERSPVRLPEENRYGQQHFPEFRRDYGRSSSRPDWSRERNSEYRDHSSRHGSRRWRERRR